MNRSDFTEPYLVALYKEHRRAPQERPTIKELIRRYNLPRDDYFEGELYEQLAVHGWASDPNLSTSYDEAKLVIGFNGKDKAERLLDAGIDPSPRMTFTDVNLGTVPAADRLVNFNHNSIEYREIAFGIKEVRDCVRQVNDLDGAERSRLISALDAAQIFWAASQLKALQLKVGVLIAVEDAAKALVGTAKAVAAALLVDTVKAFVKAQTGIDLDHI